MIKEIIKGQFPENALRISVFEEIMLVTFSIDLNFLSVSSLAFETLGFILTEPVEFHFYMNDTKMINYNPKELLNMNLQEFLGLGLLRFESSQNGNDDREQRF